MVRTADPTFEVATPAKTCLALFAGLRLQFGVARGEGSRQRRSRVMFRWVYRCGRGGVGAVIGLAALIALAEVGLRIHSLSTPPVPTTRRLPAPLAVTSWTTGWSLRPSAKQTIHPDDRDSFVFRTNRWGLRGEDPAVPKPAGVYRIVCLGDACLLGPEYPEPATFAPQLEAALQAGTNYRVEVLNAALPMGSPSLALIQAERIATLLQPDAVLLVIDAQDIVQDLALRKWITRDRQGQPVSCAPPEAAAPAKPQMLTRLRNEFRLVDYCWNRLSTELSEDRDRTPAPSRRGSEVSPDVVARTLAPLSELQRRCVAQHQSLLIVATPARGVVLSETDNSSSLSDATFFRALGDVLKQTGAIGIDATRLFAGSAAEDHSQWTAAEHRQLSEFVAQGIRERLPGPWSSPYLQENPVTPASHRVAEPRAQR